MNRKKWQIIAISLITLALIVGVQGAVLAKAAKVDVTGELAGTWVPASGDQWFSRDPIPGVRPGRLHIVDTDFEGYFNLPDLGVEGHHTMVLSCSLERVIPYGGTGPCKGPITIWDAEDTVLWEGQVFLYVVDMISSGQIVAHGVEGSPYEDTQLKLDVQEIGGSTDVFELSGQLLYPHG
jgi:hypothetical protein